jgi:membrane protein DedA with SNARE-associated domain
MLDALVSNAYWLLYAGTIMEGETALLLASLAANRGLIDLTWVIIIAFAGATTGDQISYQTVPAVRTGHGCAQCNLETAHRESAPVAGRTPGEVHHPIRFFWGLRSACMLALAASDVPTRVFAPANLVACALWATIVGSLGYVFSGWVTHIVTTMNDISGTAPSIIGGIIIFVLAVWLVRRGILKFWRSRDSL